MIEIINHGCDHECEIEKDHEICANHTAISFQDEYDNYVKVVKDILQQENSSLDSSEVNEILRSSLNIFNRYKKDLQELELYKAKFTKIRPLDIEMSKLKGCYIGKCSCGQFLIESKHICCPKCYQFVDWAYKND